MYTRSAMSGSCCCTGIDSPECSLHRHLVHCSANKGVMCCMPCAHLGWLDRLILAFMMHQMTSPARAHDTAVGGGVDMDYGRSSNLCSQHQHDKLSTAPGYEGDGTATKIQP